VSRFLVAFLLLLLSYFPAVAQSPQSIRVKCGGPSYTDSKGQVWSADHGYNLGSASQTQGSVSGTTDPALYQGGRLSDSNTGPLIYNFPVSNGSFHVNLYFAELYALDQSVGARVFNVKLQGNIVFQNLDVFAAAGANAALIKGADITVSNGAVQIELDNVIDHAKIEAIEITENAATPQLTLNFVYPDGTPVSGTLNYKLSNSLLNIGANVPLANGQASCHLLSSPSVLGLGGSFQVDLSLIDTAGRTLWQLSTTLNPKTVNFGVVQNTSISVTVQKM
jgi:hypothetical protein